LASFTSPVPVSVNNGIAFTSDVILAVVEYESLASNQSTVRLV